MGTGVEGRQEDNEGEGWGKLYLISITSLHMRRPSASAAVEFQCRPATAEFMCEALRSMHPMKEHDVWTAWIWAGVRALVCTARRAPVSEEQCRSLFGDQAALLNALAKECCKNGALSNILLGQVMSDFARKRLQDELARVCSHVSFLDNPIASAGVVDMVRPIEEEAMTALSDAMQILKAVGEQVNDQLFADQVSLRCTIWRKRSVSVVKLMMLSAKSREDCMITEERAKLVSAARASRNALQDFVENPSRLHPQSPALAGFHLNFLERHFADKSIIGNTLHDIDHVIKDVESTWRDDIMQLQAVTASRCPIWGAQG